jgi:lactoylglutathione lyase
VTGLSHVAFRVPDLVRARAFYGEFLGYATAPARAADGSMAILVAISERQYVELRSSPTAGQDRLDHVGLATDDLDAMRRYLTSRGVALAGAAGAESFKVRDPEGRLVEFVEFQPRRDGGTRDVSPGAAAVSRRLLHAGILVGDLDVANRFYGDVLGLTETWRGSRSGSELSWTNMRVPDGLDYLEFMLYGELPAPDARGTAHHICLEVPDVAAARERLLARPYAAGYGRSLEVRVGTNRKRQLNLYDPDGTRVELMEPDTVDGQPVPSSTASPPRRR